MAGDTCLSFSKLPGKESLLQETRMGTHRAAAAATAPHGAQGRFKPGLGTEKHGVNGTSSAVGLIPVSCCLPAMCLKLNSLISSEPQFLHLQLGTLMLIL